MFSRIVSLGKGNVEWHRTRILSGGNNSSFSKIKGFNNFYEKRSEFDKFNMQYNIHN